jgi:uncharacterized protein (TIGR04255 family)
VDNIRRRSLKRLGKLENGKAPPIPWWWGLFSVYTAMQWHLVYVSKNAVIDCAAPRNPLLSIKQGSLAGSPASIIFRCLCVPIVNGRGYMSAKIKPFSDKHAIKSVLFILEFATPLQPSAFTDLRVGGKLHEQLKAELPRVAEQQQMTINLAAGVDQTFFAPPAAQPSAISGIAFDKLLPNGDAELGLNIQSQALFIVCGKYVRWDDVWAQTKNYLQLLSGWMNDHVKISGMALQYIDAFTVSFPRGEKGPLTDLFSSATKYIPSNINELTDAFHSHHGFFSKPDVDIPARLLTNINVNVVEVAFSYDVQIQTLHKLELEDVISAVDDGEVVERAFRFLHADNKSVVGDLLSGPVKEQISFDVGRKN